MKRSVVSVTEDECLEITAVLNGMAVWLNLLSWDLVCVGICDWLCLFVTGLEPQIWDQSNNQP